MKSVPSDAKLSFMSEEVLRDASAPSPSAPPSAPDPSSVVTSSVLKLIIRMRALPASATNNREPTAS
jgi:hypothetical protein